MSWILFFVTMTASGWNQFNITTFKTKSACEQMGKEIAAEHSWSLVKVKCIQVCDVPKGCKERP